MQQSKIIWFAIVFSTVIYLAILIAVPPPQGSFDDAVKKPLTLILYVVALSMFIAALVVPNVLGRQGQQKMILALGLFEACAIQGLLAAFIAQDWRLYIAPWIVALIGMIREFPSAENEKVPR